MRKVWILICFLPLCLFGQDTARAKLLLERAELQYDSAAYQQAILLAEEVLTIYGEEEFPERGAAWNTLGYCYMEQGNLEQGRLYFQKALDLYLNIYGDSHVVVAQSHNNLGNYQLQKGDYSAAIAAYQKAANMRVRLLGLKHPDTADALDNIGLSLAAMGDYAQAFGFHQQALDIRIKALGKQHRDVAQSYQNMGNCYYFSGAIEEAMNYYEQCLDLRQNSLGSDHPKTAQAFNNRGNAYLQQKKIELAEVDYQSALAINLKQFGESHPAVAECKMNLGNCASQRGQFDQAAQAYESALAIQRKQLGTAHPKLANTYDNLGHSYLELGDVGEALDYYEQSAAIRKLQFEADHPYLSYNYENLGLCYQVQGDYDKALDFHLKSLKIRLDAFGDGNELVAGNYNNLGNNYFEQEDFKNALYFYKKTLPVFRKGNSLEYLTALANVGRSEAKLNQHKKAIKNYQKALGTKVPASHPARAGLFKDMALSLSKNGDYKSSKQTIEKGIELLNNGNLEEGLKFEKLQAPNILLEVLMAKAAILEKEYAKTGEAELLEKSKETYALASELMDFIFITYYSFLSRKITNEYNFKIHEKLLESNLNDFEKAFAIAEKSKNLLLIDAIRNSKAKRFHGIPDSILQKERALQSRITQFEKIRFDATFLSTKETQRLLDSSQQTKLAIRELQQETAENYPKLHQAKYASKTVSVQQVQEQLEQDQAIIEYFVGDSSIYVFIIKKEQYHFHQIEQKTALKYDIQELEDGIKYYHDSGSPTPDLYMETNQQYSNIAHKLYLLLFEPLEQYELPERLIIIPDGGLGFVPFAALLKTMPEEAHRFKTHDYLVQYYSFSYAYSAAMLQEMQAPKNHPKGSLLAFAPHFDGTDYARLKYNREEAKSITDLFGGTLLEGGEAKASRFDSLAAEYRYLHFATHGEANTQDGDYSFMVFAGSDSLYEKRYARDLYAMQLNNELSVLSACETGNGKYWRGEGIISLARGFAYAGTSSIATTLWSISDAKSAQIMPDFYQHLKQGFTKDKALQQAQISFLKNNAHDDAHPYFWSSYILIGDSQIITELDSIWLPRATILLLVLILSVFLFYKWTVTKK